MKKKIISLLIFFNLISVFQYALAQESQKGRALSLRILQEQTKACQKKGECPEELLNLAGISEIIGYVVDEKNHDIILIGEVNINDPPLYLEDFVVALRNTWLKYSIKNGNIFYYSDPGCSIDPDKRIIRELDLLVQKIFSCTSPEEVEKYIQDWHQICQSPQNVRILGIPFNTRFSWVMVKADYDMKRIVDGYESLDIPGFNSLMDMTLEVAKRDIIHGRRLSIPFSSMNRFWFYPGENTFKEDHGIVLIERSQVILLTEEEHLSKDKRIVGTGRVDPLAKQFTNIFTQKYEQVAQKKPIYKELGNLFRFVALAKIFKFKSPHNEAKMDLGFLLDEFNVSQTPVTPTLPGRSNVKRFQHKMDFTGGYQIIQLWLPSCGGVNINILRGAENV